MIPVVIAFLAVTCALPEEKYIVTLPLYRLTGEQRGITFSVCGKDRLDALANSGVTVWTEEEWRQAQNRRQTGKKKSK